MPRRYLKASTAILSLPKKIVFVDKKNKKHLLPALTKTHHLASHYGHSAVELVSGKSNYVNLLNRGTLDAKKLKKRATKKVKEATKASSEVKTSVKKAKEAINKVEKAKRVYKKKKAEATVATTVAEVAKKRGRPRKIIAAPSLAAAAAPLSAAEVRAAKAIKLGMHPSIAALTVGAAAPIPTYGVVAAAKKRGRPRKTSAVAVSPAVASAIVDAAVSAEEAKKKSPTRRLPVEKSGMASLWEMAGAFV